jgi:hypothetical protein
VVAGRVGCTARSRIPCGCGPFLCSLPPNPACTFQRTGLSSDLCRVRDRVCVDPVISCRARGERQVPLRLLHCASLMVPSSFIACAPSPCGPSLAVTRLVGRYPDDYCGHSVAIGLASLRRSHVHDCCTCLARLRHPVRLLECPDRASLLRPRGLQRASRQPAAGAGTGFRRLSGRRHIAPSGD